MSFGPRTCAVPLPAPSGRPSSPPLAPEQIRLLIYAALLTSTLAASTPCRWNTSLAAPLPITLPVHAPLALLTSTFSASTPCRWNTSWAPSSSGLVTKLLKRATTTPNLGGGGGGGGGGRVQGSGRAITTPNLGGGEGGSGFRAGGSWMSTGRRVSGGYRVHSWRVVEGKGHTGPMLSESVACCWCQPKHPMHPMHVCIQVQACEAVAWPHVWIMARGAWLYAT